MLWKKEDIEQYSKAKEYIDTALIPLVPFSVEKDEEWKTKTVQYELIHLFTKEMEKEFKGRMVLFPDYAYVSTAAKETEAERLSEWVKNIKTQPFEHIFFLTFDSQWRKQERMLDGTVIWLPGLPGGDIRGEETQSTMKAQVREITEFIRSYWS